MVRKLLAGNNSIACVEEFKDPTLFEATIGLDLEGIVAKRTTDPYDAGTVWIKVKNARYSQNEGRWELFQR